MTWYVAFLGVATAIALLSLASATLRRVWTFQLFTLKYLLLGVADLLQARRLWSRVRGRPYRRLGGPAMLRLFCEDMGPTFIKFGQIVASSGGLFPDRYVREFQKVLDRVRPFPFSEVERIVGEELGPERAAQLGSIDPEPLASASIAQVHTAELLDGTSVVVKVQRPGIARRIAADMKIMRTLAALVERLVSGARLVNPVGIVEDFAATLAEEIDFCKEAENLRRFNEIMSVRGHRNVRAPQPNWEYTTRRVLVMERFFGVRIDDTESMESARLDAEAGLIGGMRAWFQCVIFHGFFHGDVHAGNLMILDDGDVGFLDFGIVGRFDDRQRFLVTDYIVAFATGDFEKLAEVICEMGGISRDGDLGALAADLEETYRPLLTLSFGEVNYADFIPRVHRVARAHRMTMPKEFVLITKQMLYFDRYAKLLAPGLNIFRDPRLVMSMMTDIQTVRAEREAARRAREQAEAG